ncbi:hypothetical protein BRC62_04430 [Halobacteriales archaeon QH_10_67_13]|nr:MAG: hypothetical protein BRC62_04430 [Halobacteriales archaeon QH_10_67_13]
MTGGDGERDPDVDSEAGVEGGNSTVDGDDEGVDAGESPLSNGTRPATNGDDRRDRSEAAEIDSYTTERRSISTTVQLHWGLRVGIASLILGVAAAAGAGAAEIDPVVAPAISGGVLVVGLVWVVLRYRAWVYQVRADALYLERGVTTHVRTLVPYVRIQHVDTSRSPLERALGLSTLVVYTAGSRGADVSIPGLTPEQAQDLQQRVKELAIEAEGGDAL